MIPAQQSTAAATQWSFFRLKYAMQSLGLALKAYDPEQPRAPGGTEEAGQWISVGAGSSDEIVVAGGFSKSDRNLTVQDFIAKNCEGRVNRKVPGEFLNTSIGELLTLRAQGAPNADRCYKILNDNRFRK
ncbi:MAG: hypothetical protein ACRCWF_00110 [Beijerinckiaceae bacterium]